jgi:HEAT repeat protein
MKTNSVRVAARLYSAIIARGAEVREHFLLETVAAYRNGCIWPRKNDLRLILRIAQADSDPSIRLAATEALGIYGTRADRICLQDRLKDTEWTVRAAAASSLATAVGRAAKRMLVEALTDEMPIVRRYAVVALYDALGLDAGLIVRKYRDKETDDLALVGFDSVLGLIGDVDAIARLREYALSPLPRIASPAKETLASIDEV